jgi:hypothetical protein
MTSAPPIVRDRNRQVLLTDWDPSNASRFESAHGEYDSYIDPLWELISSGADPEAVVDYLRQRELESMCFPSIGKSHLKRVAERLLAIKNPST